MSPINNNKKCDLQNIYSIFKSKCLKPSQGVKYLARD